MKLYIENLKRLHPKLLYLINEFSKVEYKVNIEKSMVLLYINNELAERETKKNTIYYCNKRKKVRRNTFNQGSKMPVLGNL